MQARHLVYVGLGVVTLGAMIFYTKQAKAAARLPVRTTGWVPAKASTAQPKTSVPVKIEQIEPVTWNASKNLWQMGINVTYPSGTVEYNLEWIEGTANAPYSQAQWLAFIVDDWKVPASIVKLTS